MYDALPVEGVVANGERNHWIVDGYRFIPFQRDDPP